MCVSQGPDAEIRGHFHCILGFMVMECTLVQGLGTEPLLLRERRVEFAATKPAAWAFEGLMWHPQNHT